mgnify:CR=1 FL=1
MKEKYDNIQLDGPSQLIVSQIANIENNINELKVELVELKTSSLKDGALTEYVELIRTLENHIKELETKLGEIVNMKEKNSVKASSSDESASTNIHKVEKQEPVELVVETISKKEPEVIKPVQSDLIEEDLTAKIFDIKVIENILHEARLPECKNLKNQLMSAWGSLEDRVGGQLMYIAKILSNGLLVANGKTHLIVVYPNAQLCNHIMTPKHYENAKEVLKVTLGKVYDFVALPDDTWKEKRLEYHDKFRVGDVYPELTPINNPKLRVVVRKDTPKSEREIVIEKANSFFGDDDE